MVYFFIAFALCYVYYNLSKWIPVKMSVISLSHHYLSFNTVSVVLTVCSQSMEVRVLVEDDSTGGLVLVP